MLCKKVARAQSFVTPERLPPTQSACKFHALRTYYQVMQWMGHANDMEPTEWGWKADGNSLVPVMMDKCPAPELLLRMIHCNCSLGCNTSRCTCRKHGMECTSAWGHCQDSKCDHLPTETGLYDEEGDEEYWTWSQVNIWVVWCEFHYSTPSHPVGMVFGCAFGLCPGSTQKHGPLGHI